MNLHVLPHDKNGNCSKKSVSQYIEPIILSQCNKTIITLAAMRLQTAETNSSFDVGVRQYTSVGHEKTNADSRIVAGLFGNSVMMSTSPFTSRTFKRSTSVTGLY
ncbi:unnamed protein product [Tenebrio molitor]|nr:unnamed protein product [Tenebrio molitor]